MISANNLEWKNSGGDRKKLKDFKSCEFAPIPLRKNDADKEVILALVPDPLHVNLLGPASNAVEKLEVLWPNEMKRIASKSLGRVQVDSSMVPQ